MSLSSMNTESVFIAIIILLSTDTFPIMRVYATNISNSGKFFYNLQTGLVTKKSNPN